MIFGADDACAMGDSHPEYTLTTMEMNFDVPTAISGLEASIVAGTKNYTYDGVTGTKLTATLEFGLTEMIFYPTSTGIASDLESSTSDAFKKSIRQNLNKILPKGLAVRTRRASRDTTYAYQHDVAMSFEVSGEASSDEPEGGEGEGFISKAYRFVKLLSR